MKLESNAASPWRDRLRPSAIHLAISLTIAALAGALVFGTPIPTVRFRVDGSCFCCWLPWTSSWGH